MVHFTPKFLAVVRAWKRRTSGLVLPKTGGVPGTPTSPAADSLTKQPQLDRCGGERGGRG